MKIKKPIQVSSYERTGLELFGDAIHSYGLETNDIIVDGQVHRVRDSDKHGTNRNGWYVLDQDGDVYFGAFGSWSRGEPQKFCSVSDKTLTIDQSIRIHQRQEENKRKIEAAREGAAKRAEETVGKLPIASVDHAYLVKKKIKPNGILQREKDLLIPVYNAKGDIRTYQTISGAGDKFFLKDGEVKGNFHRLGHAGKKIFIVEGFATGATIYELTGHCVYVAFNAGNLLPVAEQVRASHKDSQIVIAADNDQKTGSQANPGVDSARFCSSQVKNCSYVFPTFKTPSDNLTDFNDLFIKEGKETTLIQLGERSAKIKANAIGSLNLNLIPKREFLYGTHLIRKFCSATISPGGVGKTQLVMLDAVSLASGRMLGHDRPYEKVNAWHYNLEDPIEELHRRVSGICKYHNVDIDLIRESLFINSGREQPLIVMEKTKQGEYARPDADALYQTIKDNEISVLSIDPFVKVHYGDENSNKDIDEVLKIFSQIANDTNCAIDLVHHTKKQSKGDSYAGNMDSARGASSLSGAVRAARTLTQMTQDEAQGFNVIDPSWYVRIDSAKANMSAPAEFTNWMERQNVEISNGDKVGTLAIWKPPTLFGKNTDQEIKDTLKLIHNGNYRKDVRSKEWVGHVIMDELNMNEQEAKRAIRKWMKEGVFIFDIAVNPDNRKPVWYVKIDHEKAGIEC